MCRSFQVQHRYVFQPNIPRCNTTLGDVYEEPLNTSTYDFCCNYRSRLDTSWVPTRTSRPDPPLLQQSSEKYHRSVGQLPGYSGHVPGDIQRFGRSYGYDTKDPKRYIRGD